MKTNRLLLVEDHALVRAGLRALLERIPGVEVVGEACDGHDALRQMVELRPDVVLMDISMPGLNGLETVRRTEGLEPRPRVVMLSVHANKEYVRQALVAGAVGYLLKTADPLELELALAAVARGEVWISAAVAQAVVDGVLRGWRGADPVADLTGRQREVLQLVAEGRSTKDVARLLTLSVKTVESHRAQIMERLDIHSIAGLVRYAIRTGMISSDP